MILGPPTQDQPTDVRPSLLRKTGRARLEAIFDCCLKANGHSGAVAVSGRESLLAVILLDEMLSGMPREAKADAGSPAFVALRLVQAIGRPRLEAIRELLLGQLLHAEDCEPVNLQEELDRAVLGQLDREVMDLSARLEDMEGRRTALRAKLETRGAA